MEGGLVREGHGEQRPWDMWGWNQWHQHCVTGCPYKQGALSMSGPDD